MKRFPMKSALVRLLVVAMSGLAADGVASARDFDELRKVLVSPTVNTPEYFQGFGGFCGWPKVICLHNGDLFVSFEAGYWHASWPTPLDFPPDYLKRMTAANPVLKEWHEQNKAPEGARNYWIRSKDGGRTWTRGPEIDSTPLLGAWTWTGGKPVQLADGTIVAPVTGYLSRDDMDGIRQSCGVLRGDADGRDWSFSLVARSRKNTGQVFSEPAMARLNDGRLVFMIRGQNRVRDAARVPDDERRGLYHSISEDGGKTWSPPVRVLAGTHCSIVELADGKLLCGWHRPVRYAVSSDAGRSWSRPTPWFVGAGTHQGTYTHVELVDEQTAVVMIREEKRASRLWASRLLAVVEFPEVDGTSPGSR